MTNLPLDRDLLRTKFAVPDTGAPLISRVALLARLDDAARSRITLVSAPAGFGKTTLLAQWVQQRNTAAATAWLTLDADDDDPVRFWRYVINACRRFGAPDATIGLDALDALRAAPQADIPSALTAFLNDVAQVAQPCTLVIDDLHTITSNATYDSLAHWLERLPPSIHVVLATREDPPLPLARMRGRGQLRELRAADMRFSPAEAETFAANVLPQPMSAQAIAQLDAQLEGWPAGWRMALLLAQQDGAYLPANVAAPHIIDYFVSEVLAAQPPHVQDFLLRTSFLNRLNAALCDDATTRDDSRDMLQRLERSNIFVQRLPVDGTTVGAWYRYHALFSEALRQAARDRLSEDDIHAVLARATGWFERNDSLPEAIDTALAAREHTRAADLIERYFERQRYGELNTTRRWLEQLPKPVIDTRPGLLFMLAMARLYTGDRLAPQNKARIDPLLDIAEDAWRDMGDWAQVGRVKSFRSLLAFWQSDYVQSAQLARESLALLPEYDAEWRGISLLQIGFDEFREGRLAELPPLLTEARALCAASGNVHAALAALIAAAETHVVRGDFQQAALSCTQTLEEAGAPEHDADRQAALVWLGHIAFEQNDLAATQTHAAGAIELGVPNEGPAMLYRAELLQVQAQHALGDGAKARAALQRRIAAITRPELLQEALQAQARLALADGDVAQAQSTLASLRAHPPNGHLQAETEAMLAMWLACAQRKPQDALQVMGNWPADALANDRGHSVLQWAAFEAQARALLNDDARARVALADALAIAQRANIRRPLIEMGAPLAAALQRFSTLWRDTPAEPFVRELLAAMAVDADVAGDLVPSEPLSVQEERVLRLLAAGLTNADIARELSVSVNTVKTQTQSIYRKLNVNSREAARDAARRLRLV